MPRDPSSRLQSLRALRGVASLVAGVVLLVALPHGNASAQKGKPTDDAATQVVAPAQPVRPTPPNGKGPNAFNRLLNKGALKLNAPPTEDGIHDTTNPGTQLLQQPAEAFHDLPKSPTGNMVDWVKSFEKGLIQPRFDIEDPTAEPMVMDLDIVREVKGSMPDVVYPHKQHTEWLDCTNCHDEIFVPEKGKNQISMAAILLGQKCGVCHGKVAFPVSDCRRCHAKPKTPEQLRAMAKQ